MPLSVIIEKDKVASVNESTVKNNRGIWINADVKVFIPYDVLDMSERSEEENFVPQDKARESFLKLESIQKDKPLLFDKWESEFLTGMTEWFDKGMMFSKKQKMKIKALAEKYEEVLKTEKRNMSINEEENLPF